MESESVTVAAFMRTTLRDGAAVFLWAPARIDQLIGGQGRDVFNFFARWGHSLGSQYEVTINFSFRHGDKIGFYPNSELSVGQTRDGNLLIFQDRGTIEVDARSLQNEYSGHD